MSLLVFGDGIDGVDIGQRTAHLLGMTAVGDFQQTMSGGSGHDVTILTQKETRHVTWDNVSVEVFYLYIMELVAVVSLERTVHTHVKQTVLVLCHTVHIVAGHTVLHRLFFLQDVELIAVVHVQTIACGDPYQAVVIEIYLTGEAAG